MGMLGVAGLLLTVSRGGVVNLGRTGWQKYRAAALPGLLLAAEVVGFSGKPAPAGDQLCSARCPAGAGGSCVT